MKKILTILLILWSLNGISQGRLGYTYAEVYDEFYDKVTNFEFQKNILLNFNFFDVYHLFNENGYCLSSTIFVADVKSAEYFINKYNKEYINMGKGVWAMVADGFNVYCTMNYEEEIKRITFTWTYDL